MTAVLGIDPGLKGAVSLLRLAQNRRTVQVWDLPTRSAPRAGRKQIQELDENAFSTMVDMLVDEVDVAYIEKVGSMPGQGVTSMFRFGMIYGQIRMALAYAELPYKLVAPSTWKRTVGVGANKDSSLLMALEVFGDEYRPLWFGRNMGILDGRCEAALIAYYGLTKQLEMS